MRPVGLSFFCLLLGLFLTSSVNAGSWIVSKKGPLREIQEAVEQSRDGDTILVEAGHYEEETIDINKSLTLLAKGDVILDGQNKIEIITVTKGRVTIDGFTIMNSGNQSIRDIAGIKVLSCRYVTIRNNKIQNCNFGIYLSNTVGCIVQNNTIRGNSENDKTIGNGIHVWKADSVLIENNHSSHQRDGIYFEFVTNSLIRQNTSTNNMRYGLHFMFSHSNEYNANRFINNGAGVAVMYSHHVKMYNNHFDHNWGASAYGILLKDISDSEIIHNTFSHNSAGIYMEGSNRIRTEKNLFDANGWALRVQASCQEIHVINNNFIGNTFDVSTNGETQLNYFNGNYWDKYEGYDLDRNGIGDIPYRPVSLFSVIVEQLPPGLLLLRSFMVYLLDKAEKIIPSLTPVELKDETPFVRPLDHTGIPDQESSISYTLTPNLKTNDHEKEKSHALPSRRLA